jgi:hypothetical protein
MIIRLEMYINTATHDVKAGGEAIGVARSPDEVSEQQAAYAIIKDIMCQAAKMAVAITEKELVTPAETHLLQECIVASGVLDFIMQRQATLNTWIENGKDMNNIPDTNMFLAFLESCERDDLRDVLRTAPDANGYGSGTDTPTQEELNRLRAIMIVHPDEGR